MSRFWKIALIAIALVVLAAVSFRLLHKPAGGPERGRQPGAAAGGASGKDASAKDKAPVPVTVVKVTRENVPIYLTALGTVQALNTVTVNPQIGGQLMSLNFTEGQEVKKGQMIAQIDPRSLQASLDQATAKKAQDEALLSTDRSNYERSKDPNVAKYLAKQNLDQLRNQVAQDEATVAADNAAIRNAQVQLGFTRIVSPIDGVAGIRNVDVGNVVTPTTAIVTLTQVHPIYVMFFLPEQNLDPVRTAQQAGALDVAALDRTDAHVMDASGKLQVIDNQIDQATGTFKLRAQFPNADSALWPGQFVNVRLQVRTVTGGLVIPAQAVQRGPDGDYVYLVQADSTVKMQPVTQGAEVGESRVMISKGLNFNDQVVTEGQFRLKPGSKVQALQPGQVPSPPTQAELDSAAKKPNARRGGRGG
jgi:multidrug efflux system membrane fusion protein